MKKLFIVSVLLAFAGTSAAGITTGTDTSDALACGGDDKPKPKPKPDARPKPKPKPDKPVV